MPNLKQRDVYGFFRLYLAGLPVELLWGVCLYPFLYFIPMLWGQERDADSIVPVLWIAIPYILLGWMFVRALRRGLRWVFTGLVFIHLGSAVFAIGSLMIHRDLIRLILAAGIAVGSFFVLEKLNRILRRVEWCPDLDFLDVSPALKAPHLQWFLLNQGQESKEVQPISFDLEGAFVLLKTADPLPKPFEKVTFQWGDLCFSGTVVSVLDSEIKGFGVRWGAFDEKQSIEFQKKLREIQVRF